MNFHSYEIEFQPEHWNQNCQALIPAAYNVLDRFGFVIASGWTEKEAQALILTIEER